MIECSRIIEFDAAHRVVGHENKCKYLHGHRYKIIISFASENLDKLGRVIDFGSVKSILGEWIDNNWDHNAILWKEDKLLGSNIASVTNQKIYYLDNNPTAENMAQYLLNVICPKLFEDSYKMIYSITLYETPNCFVCATR